MLTDLLRYGDNVITSRSHVSAVFNLLKIDILLIKFDISQKEKRRVKFDLVTIIVYRISEFLHSILVLGFTIPV